MYEMLIAIIHKRFIIKNRLLDQISKLRTKFSTTYFETQENIIMCKKTEARITRYYVDGTLNSLTYLILDEAILDGSSGLIQTILGRVSQRSPNNQFSIPSSVYGLHFLCIQATSRMYLWVRRGLQYCLSFNMDHVIRYLRVS